MQHVEVVKAVRAALERDPAINLHRFPIEVNRAGDALRLEGEVENIIAKRRALQLAQTASGGSDVDDQLRVRLAQPQQDDELTQTVVHTLAGEPVFANFAIRANTMHMDRQDWIGVESVNGRVILHGQANSLSHRRLAEVLSWWVRGCADVENRIHVYPAENDNDDEINDAVRLVLDKDPSLDAQQIGTATRDREVHLSGVVPSEEARRVAAYDCWYIPGVHQVHNELHVRPENRSR